MNGAVIVTVDVEDYFMSPESIPVRDWEAYPQRLEFGMNVLLELLAETGARATFFWLGWLAQRYPWLVKRCAQAGHEIGVHGWDHRPPWMLGRAGFRASLKRSVAVLEELAGMRAAGHRAPEYALHRNQGWMWDILTEQGFIYDSSLLPVSTYLFGDHKNSPYPHIINSPSRAPMVEWPIATIAFLGRRWPVASGGFMRALPAWWPGYALKRWTTEALAREAPSQLSGAVINVHPWELDPQPPRLPLPWRERLIHEAGLGTVAAKLRALLWGKPTASLKDTVMASGLMAG